MNIQQIRNATVIVDYAGSRFLIDPMLGEKGIYPPFPNSARQDQFNPLIDLPFSIDKIIEGIDAVIITHLHYDHWDELAQKVLSKQLKIFVQNESDALSVSDTGFNNVEVLTNHTLFNEVELIKTEGQHGWGNSLEITGSVCGVVFKHPTEENLYVTGDTVWYEAMQKVIDTHEPRVIIANAGGNHFNEGEPLIMDEKDLIELHTAARKATILSVHMEAVNHWGTNRKILKNSLIKLGMEANVYVGDDGESFIFNK